ncbi:MAG TPA: TrbG/VirB9 family P-type conjugative transfer protein [Bdellovibrionota bacterium]|nr:TrbG/VirB9 family P-type conjugative transfer protein [Bdellovibrionota bacterium]
MHRFTASLCVVLTLIHAHHSYADKINEGVVSPKSISTIHTSVGYTSLIELPDRPRNVVIGDQDAFKVEFLGNTLAVKPLMSGVRTNLFIFTESDRFNCTLVSGSTSQVDYIVRLESNTPEVVRLNLLKTNGLYSVQLFDLKRGRRTAINTLRFKIINDTDSKILLDPYQINILLKNRPLPIESIFLESKSVKPHQAIEGNIVFKNESREKIVFEMTPQNQGQIRLPY